ncbi:hypothetical protein DVH24_022968 [Malus domestica]|uniref:Uncharacterized protein n=1 Tax=Malus domestica TaxID=3750 RepID=A0A498KQT5_MALDO|nr:hypothetical protein DVH24_022968 [Malus domestica]
MSPCKSATATMIVMALERNYGPTIDMVEEQMSDYFIKNKRPKSQLSPSAAALAEERRLNRDGFVGSVKGFDPQGSNERAFGACVPISWVS